MNTRNGNKKGKKLLALVLTLALLLTVAIPAAADTGITGGAITTGDSEAIGAETPEGSDSNVSDDEESKIGGGRSLL
jgi:hypothetical protein